MKERRMKPQEFLDDRRLAHPAIAIDQEAGLYAYTPTKAYGKGPKRAGVTLQRLAGSGARQ